MALLDLRTGRHRQLATELPETWIFSLAFARDGTRIVAPSSQGTHVWDVASGEIVESYRNLERMDAASSDIVIDRRGLAIFTSGDGSISAWDPDGARRVGRVFPRPPGATSAPDGPAWRSTRTAPWRRSRLGDGTVRTGRPAHHGGHATSSPRVTVRAAKLGLAFFAGGRRLATGGTDGTVTIWDVPSRAVVRRLRFAEPVEAMAVSPDGTLIAVQRQAEAAPDSHVEVRDLASGKTLYTRTIRFAPGGVSFSGDGRALVASGCCDGGSTVTGWDARTGATAIPAHGRAADRGDRDVARRADARRRRG